jgi:hypothetical protein
MINFIKLCAATVYFIFRGEYPKFDPRPRSPLE